MTRRRRHRPLDRRGIVEPHLVGDRMRFAVNVPAAERTGLRLGSRLPSLARVVRSAGVL